MLTSLDLSKNNLTNYGKDMTGIYAIADTLKVNGVLTTLNLSSNYLGSERYVKASKVEGESKKVGDKVIYEGREMTVSKGVDKDGDLKVVDLSGMLAMSKALEVNRVLTKLSVAGNDIGPVGAKAFADALRVNGVMTKLDVRYNK